MCDPTGSIAGSVRQVLLHTPRPENAALYRQALAGVPGAEVVLGARLDGFMCDAVIAPTNSFGYLDSGLDGAFGRRFGARLQRTLQERIAREHDGELPVGEALIVPTGDFAVPFLVAAPATRLPGSISVEPFLYSSLSAAMQAIDRWNARHEGPAIEVVALPDIARMLPEWQPERLTMQLRQAMIDWSAHAAPALGQARAA
ncbi:MAG: macro domain-containing protein [Phycisphaerales bacterium]